MVVQVQIKYDTSRVQHLFKMLPENIRQEVGNGMFKIAKSYQRSLRYSLNKNSKRFDFKIWDGIEAKKLSNNQSVVNMPLKGVYLDDMIPHYVALKKGRMITKWATQHSNLDSIRERQGSIYVKPHPFIFEGMMRGRIGRQKIMQEAMDNAIKKSQKR